MTRPGFWTDVLTLPNGSFHQVTVDGAIVRGFTASVQTWQVEAPEALGFCRCALVDGKPVSIHQGQSGTAWLVSPASVTSLGLTFGVQPVAIDSTYAYVVRSSTTYDRIRLANGESESLPHGVPGSSQGISDVEPNGTIRWADLHRSLRWNGITLTYPNARGNVVVGQCDPPQIAGIQVPGPPFTAFEGDGFEPHIAFNGDRYAIVARTGQGAAYLEGPPWPPFVGATPPPVEPPKPQPTPEPIPVSIPNQLSTVQRVRGKYPTPLGDRHAAFLIDVAQQTGGKLLRKEAGTHVRLPNGIGVSQDILMIGDQGIDILSDGEGAAIPAWQEKGVIIGEYIDVGGVPVEPQPGPAPAPQPVPVDYAAILARLDLSDKRAAAAQAETNATILRLAEAIEKIRIPAPAQIVFPVYEGTAKLGTRMTFTLEPRK